MFQLPYLPELMMKSRDFKLLEEVFLSKRMVTRIMCILVLYISLTTQGLRNKTGFSNEVLEAFKYNFSQPGACTAAINYYRNIFNAPKSRHSEKIEKPVLVIWVCTMLLTCILYMHKINPFSNLLCFQIKPVFS